MTEQVHSPPFTGDAVDVCWNAHKTGMMQGEKIRNRVHFFSLNFRRLRFHSCEPRLFGEGLAVYAVAKLKGIMLDVGPS